MAMRSIVHVEIPANDPAATARFYTTLFGLAAEVDEQMNYTSFRAGNTGGGFPKVGEMATAGEVIVYLDSPSINEDLSKIEGLGGCTIVPKTEIPGMGYFAIFTDPTGNKVGLFESLPGQGPAGA
jgi:uncharacterized protein